MLNPGIFTGGIDTLPLGSEVKTPHDAFGSWCATNIYGTSKRAEEAFRKDEATEHDYQVARAKAPEDYPPRHWDIYRQLYDELQASVGGLARAISSLSSVEALLQSGDAVVQTINHIHEDGGRELPAILIEAGELSGAKLTGIVGLIVHGSTSIELDGRATAHLGEAIWTP